MKEKLIAVVLLLILTASLPIAEGKINCSCPSADSHGKPPHCSFKMF